MLGAFFHGGQAFITRLFEDGVNELFLTDIQTFVLEQNIVVQNFFDNNLDRNAADFNINALLQDPNLGVFQGETVLPPITAVFFEGMMRRDSVRFNGIPQTQRTQDIANAVFAAVQINNDANAEIGAILNQIANAQLANVVVGNDNDLASMAIEAITNIQTPLTPSVFCLEDAQCLGVREERVVVPGGLGEHVCFLQADVAGLETNECNDFVAFFTLRWLAFVIGLTYGIITLWAIYMYYPTVKNKLCGGNKKAQRASSAKADYSEQDQIIINTLATQCASAENLLFQATDMLKQAKNLQSILSVEAKRESRIMILTCEYFQAACSIMVALTHDYIDRKTFTPGQTWNVADPGTRALQLEVLNYARERLQLAFQSDALTEKSLLRIAEAYAVLKKVTDSLVLVGFSCDREVDNSLGTLKTPFVELTENAFYLAGTYRAMSNIPGADAYNGKKVCVIMENADPRDATPMAADAYLSNQQRDSKVYDPGFQTVKGGKTGKCLTYNSINSGQTGDGLQFFVRTFWGPEIAAIQQEASSWLTSDGGLERWLERERMERESRAGPVLKRGPKKKRKKHNKKKKKGYADVDETATEISEYTEASGWSVDSSNNYVYNVQSIVNQGLGIAGKPGLPYDKPGEKTVHKGSKLYQLFEEYFPNCAEWPKFYTLVFVVVPLAVFTPMIVQIGLGTESIDIDNNFAFKARVAGFGTSFLGVPAYYFLDGFVPEVADLVGPGVNEVDLSDAGRQVILTGLANVDPFNNGGELFISNIQAATMFAVDFNGSSNRVPNDFIAEIQAGILHQTNVGELDGIRNQQLAQEVTTLFVYGLMHNAGYFFSMVPLTLIRESLELISRRLPIIRSIWPLSIWRELHMAMGLSGIYYVVFGATFFLVASLIGIGKSTPFGGAAGDPNIPVFFNMIDNVLYIRQLLLPFVPFLLLLKYAAQGPPNWMLRYCPTVITKNYWEICYALHYITAMAAIIILVIYRAQVFYWMGATWGLVWGGNKVLRILRTRRTTIKQTNLISYTVEDKRNNAKKRSDVLRIMLNVPSSFPASARGQACWLTCPYVDYVAHPFTLAKSPSENDHTIMFHIAVRYLPGDDIISGARPDTQSASKPITPIAPPANPNELPPGWKSAVDPESNQTYYYNSAEKRTTWNRPKATAVDKLFDGVRGITSRMSANFLRGGSTRLGQVNLNDNTARGDRAFTLSNRATWTQKFANLAQKLSTMDPDLRRNAVKDFPVYVSAPLGTSMDDCLLPSLPGSIIITTQNGLPAAESSVRWLLKQGSSQRPKFHFFVNVSRDVNDALSVVETLRDAMCDSVASGHLDIDGLSGKHAHMVDWLGVYINLTRRQPSTIQGDREMIMASLNPPAAPVTERQLALINDYIKNRVKPGRLPFDRFLARTQQMVMKRTGLDNLAVGYCGSSVVAHTLRSACRSLQRVKFDGEYI